MSILQIRKLRSERRQFAKYMFKSGPYPSQFASSFHAPNLNSTLLLVSYKIIHRIKCGKKKKGLIDHVLKEESLRLEGSEMG